jgi:SOS-response transcriptional repressor LexA
VKAVKPESIAVYECLEQEYRLTGRFPGYRKIAQHCGYASSNTIEYHIHKLVTAGWLEVCGQGVYKLLREPKTFYIERKN